MRSTMATTIKTDKQITRFLRTCTAGQCLGIAAWAATILKTGQMTMRDLERCFNLGFEG
jgi:hypothetical protein